MTSSAWRGRLGWEIPECNADLCSFSLEWKALNALPSLFVLTSVKRVQRCVKNFILKTNRTIEIFQAGGNALMLSEQGGTHD